jgi:hypothetical protein
MSSEQIKSIEGQRQALLQQLTTAEAALRAGLQTRGFGSTAPEHMERALAHIREAYIAINEGIQVRTVQQLTNDLERIQQVMETAKRGQSPRI